jgi:hypothetical protein
MLHFGELMRDVKGDARTRMAHLPRNRDDVCSMSNQVRAERMPEIVKG